MQTAASTNWCGTTSVNTPDPIKLAGGLNNYQYVPNPAGWVDPLGLNNCPGAGKGSCKVDSPQEQASVNTGEPKAPGTSGTGIDWYVPPSGPEGTLPSTGYRYANYKKADGEIDPYAQRTIDTKEARLSYFGFEKFETADDAIDALQIRAPKHVKPGDKEGAWGDARLRLKFDTLQLYKDGIPRVKIPKKYGGTGDKLEPFTKVYPQYGRGGARQLIPNAESGPVDIKVDEIKVLPEN